MSAEEVTIAKSPKLGDLVKANPLNVNDVLAVKCIHRLEVIEDLGEKIRVRCFNNGMKYKAHKKYFLVIKTLEQRLEENNLKPVMGLDR